MHRAAAAARAVPVQEQDRGDGQQRSSQAVLEGDAHRDGGQPEQDDGAHCAADPAAVDVLHARVLHLRMHTCTTKAGDPAAAMGISPLG